MMDNQTNGKFGPVGGPVSGFGKSNDWGMAKRGRGGSFGRPPRSNFGVGRGSFGMTRNKFGFGSNFGIKNFGTNSYGPGSNSYGPGSNNYGWGNNNYGPRSNNYGWGNNNYGWGTSNDGWANNGNDYGYDNDDYNYANDDYNYGNNGCGFGSNNNSFGSGISSFGSGNSNFKSGNKSFGSGSGLGFGSNNPSNASKNMGVGCGFGFGNNSFGRGILGAGPSSFGPDANNSRWSNGNGWASFDHKKPGYEAKYKRGNKRGVWRVRKARPEGWVPPPNQPKTRIDPPWWDKECERLKKVTRTAFRRMKKNPKIEAHTIAFKKARSEKSQYIRKCKLEHQEKVKALEGDNAENKGEEEKEENESDMEVNTDEEDAVNEETGMVSPSQ